MNLTRRYDAVVVGAGPNGLAAAITLAQAELSVLVVEANDAPGGGASSRELTAPGFVHDVFSAVHPLAVGSPFFRTLPLERHGLEWIHPPAPLAHPFDDGTAAVLERSVADTVRTIDAGDAGAYCRLMETYIADWPKIESAILAPPKFPRHPFALARFGWRAVRSAKSLAESVFRGGRARALLAGSAAHSGLPLERAASAAFGLVLNVAGHVVGWPIPRGGAQKITDALVAHFTSLGGEIRTNVRVESLAELPASRVVLCDVTPRQLVRIAKDRLPSAYRRRLDCYRYGVGVFKMDWALSAPIPWRAKECARAGTIHIGGTLGEIAAAERASWRGEHDAKPFVLLAQPSLFDATRAPAGGHTAWAYCHVPNSSAFDMSERIESQIERFAPGFRDCIVARRALPPAELERRNANLVGGDVNGGAQDAWQLFLRPTWRLYRTPAEGLYICSSSTPPGGGVHGMCGHHAARLVLKRLGKSV